MDTIRILLVDDHALFRSGLAELLRKKEGFEVVGEASNGKEAIEQAHQSMPDMILMDVSMPVMDGLEATRVIKQELPYIKIVMLTASDGEKDLFEAIKVGAQGYLLKNLEPARFYRTLRGAFHGEAPITRTTAVKILGEFSRLASGQGQDASHQKLSPRESEVLGLLTKGSTNKEMAEELFISENTIKNHLKNILAKLHLKNRVQAAAFALSEGLTGKPTTEHERSN